MQIKITVKILKGDGEILCVQQFLPTSLSYQPSELHIRCIHPQPPPCHKYCLNLWCSRYLMLHRLPYLLQFFLKFCKKYTDCEDKTWYLIFLFVAKALAVILLVLFDGLVYYFVPIDISFDIVGNNFLSIYNTAAVFLTAMVHIFSSKEVINLLSVSSLKLETK